MEHNKLLSASSAEMVSTSLGNISPIYLPTLQSPPPPISALQDLAAKVWPVSQQHLAPVRDTGYQAPIQTG